MKNEAQQTLFEDSEWWKEHWQDMPEFIQEDQSPWQTVLVHFESIEDRNIFAKLINQKMTHRTKSVWFPEVRPMDLLKMKCIDES